MQCILGAFLNRAVYFGGISELGSVVFVDVSGMCSVFLYCAVHFVGRFLNCAVHFGCIYE